MPLTVDISVTTPTLWLVTTTDCTVVLEPSFVFVLEVLLSTEALVAGAVVWEPAVFEEGELEVWLLV